MVWFGLSVISNRSYKSCLKKEQVKRIEKHSKLFFYFELFRRNYQEMEKKCVCQLTQRDILNCTCFNWTHVARYPTHPSLPPLFWMQGSYFDLNCRDGRYRITVNLLRKYLGDVLITSYMDTVQESGYTEEYVKEIEVRLM